MQGEDSELMFVPEQLQSAIQCLVSECKVLLHQANASAKDRQQLMQVSKDAAPQSTKKWPPAAKQILLLVDSVHQTMQASGHHHSATMQAVDNTYIDSLQACQSKLEELDSLYSSTDFGDVDQ